MASMDDRAGSPGGAAPADNSELVAAVARARAAFVEARYRKSSGLLKKTHTVGNLRRDCARAQGALAASMRRRQAQGA